MNIFEKLSLASLLVCFEVASWTKIFPKAIRLMFTSVCAHRERVWMLFSLNEWIWAFSNTNQDRPSIMLRDHTEITPRAICTWWKKNSKPESFFRLRCSAISLETDTTDWVEPWSQPRPLRLKTVAPKPVTPGFIIRYWSIIHSCIVFAFLIFTFHLFLTLVT